jgi:hypothetical protein
MCIFLPLTETMSPQRFEWTSSRWWHLHIHLPLIWYESVRATTVTALTTKCKRGHKFAIKMLSCSQTRERTGLRLQKQALCFQFQRNGGDDRQLGPTEAVMRLVISRPALK